MSISEHLVTGRRTLNNAVPDTQTLLWNIKIIEPVETDVKIESIEDDKSPWSDMMISAKSMQSPEYVNYYDNMSDVLKQLKVELSDSSSDFESSCSSQSDIFFNDEKLLKHLSKKQSQNNNNLDDNFLPKRKLKESEKKYEVTIKTEKLEDQEITDNKYHVTIKTERLEDKDTSVNVKNASVHYDVLVTPKKVQCKWCGRSFKNSFNLLRHNIEHMKLNIKITGRIKKDRFKYKPCKKLKRPHLYLRGKHDTNRLYKCDVCDTVFKQHSNMVIHMNTVHSKKRYYCDLCGKHFRCVQYIRTHMQSIHLPEMRENNLKCQYCDVVLKHKYNLHCHVKTLHNNEIFKCEECDAAFKCKQYLIMHCKRMHYNYGRKFPCPWCEKEYRTPFHLRDHTKRSHIDQVKKEKAGVAVEKVKKKL